MRPISFAIYMILAVLSLFIGLIGYGYFTSPYNTILIIVCIIPLLSVFAIFAKR